MDSKIGDIIYCEKKRDCKWKGFALDGNGYGIGRIENFVQAWREWHEKECGGKLIQAVIVSENALYSQEPKVVCKNENSTKLTDVINKIPGVEKSYWDSVNSKLTVYYDEKANKHAIQIAIADHIVDKDLHAAIEKQVYVSTEKGTFKEIKQPQSVSTPTEGMELSNEEIDKKYGIKYLNDTITVKQAYEIRDAQLAKVLSNLPTKQGIREKTQDKIARDLYKIIADNNYDMASVIRYLDKIVKLKAGQSPKEV